MVGIKDTIAQGRRMFIKALGLGALAGGAAMAAKAAPAEAAMSGKQKVVYHLSDPQKVNFVLGNIRNHIKGMKGPDHVDIVLVIHGPALKAFHSMEALEGVKKKVAALQGDGIRFNACGNTMRAQKVSTSDLLPNFVRVPQGGVVRIAQLQEKGYIYIRP